MARESSPDLTFFSTFPLYTYYHMPGYVCGSYSFISGNSSHILCDECRVYFLPPPDQKRTGGTKSRNFFWSGRIENRRGPKNSSQYPNKTNNPPSLQWIQGNDSKWISTWSLTISNRTVAPMNTLAPKWLSCEKYSPLLMKKTLLKPWKWIQGWKSARRH